MGFIRGLLRNHHQTDPVRGTALVVAVNDWLLETHKPYTLRATLVVEADGVPKTTVEHCELVNASTGNHLDRWPAQGDTIPVTVDRHDPTRVVIEWKAMRGHSDTQREAAAERSEAREQELLAQAYGTPTTPPTTPPGNPATVRHKVCPRCGRTNPARFAFCGPCGCPLPAKPVD
jgi:hypothetical protein